MMSFSNYYFQRRCCRTWILVDGWFLLDFLFFAKSNFPVQFCEVWIWTMCHLMPLCHSGFLVVLGHRWLGPFFWWHFLPKRFWFLTLYCYDLSWFLSYTCWPGNPWEIIIPVLTTCVTYCPSTNDQSQNCDKKNVVNIITVWTTYNNIITLRSKYYNIEAHIL